jgi:L-2-hydroxyglutarate oxidase LhgO
MNTTNITIIGAGCVGLAIGYELSRVYKDIIILEKETACGTGISSRNSEVIHAGLYYPKGSAKQTTCVEGRMLLYEFCRKFNVPHKAIGKFVVAVDASETADLHALYQNGVANGVNDLRLISRKALLSAEPNVRAHEALFSPSTGIIDTHSFIKVLALLFKNQGGEVGLNTEVINIRRNPDGYRVEVRDCDSNIFTFHTNVLINCAGLTSDHVGALAGLDLPSYKIKFCKGDYFRVSSGKAGLIRHLVYPVPYKKAIGLGIHATIDLAGELRLGPDAEYVDSIEYRVDPAKRGRFYKNAVTFLPFLEELDLTPDIAGIRPKLQGPGEDFRDFIIQEETEAGFPGLINLIGIESPGLTAALSIARLVKNKAQKIASLS